MKVKITISVDKALLTAVNPRNRSKYFEDLLRADVVEQHRATLTKQMEDHLCNSPTFNRYLRQLVTEAIEGMRQDY